MATKKTDSKEKKKPINEEVKTVEEKKIVPAEVTLQRIFYCLIVIAIILLFGVIGIYAGVENKSGTSSGNSQEETEIPEYDASMFTQVTADEFVEAFNGSQTSIIYIGRPTCSYCAAFLPTLQQAQSDFGYTTLYLDIDEVESSEISKITQLDDWLNTYYGTTPLVIVVKDGKIQGEGWIGYADYETFAAYLESLGFTKEN